MEVVAVVVAGLEEVAMEAAETVGAVKAEVAMAEVAGGTKAEVMETVVEAMVMAEGRVATEAGR
jgi:hypothetical protein